LKFEVHCGDCGVKLKASDNKCRQCGSLGDRYLVSVEENDKTSVNMGVKQENLVGLVKNVMKSWSERARRFMR
jgi:hypothetical protein